MATNKNALIRYRTIDKALQNRAKKWTLNDLIQECSDALYEYEGKDTYVSKRTIQLDIQIMRSNKLGYNAPIIVYDRKYYTYEEEDYSITNIPITQIDLDVLEESVEVLSQFKDFSLFSELQGVIQKLEDKVHNHSENRLPIIHMEKNDQLKGLIHLDPLYQAILKKLVLCIDYKSFNARESNVIVLHPYILKEYNNRWFVVGRKHDQEAIMTLALDRIESFTYDLKITYSNDGFDADQYYKDTYGVTVLNDNQIIDIELKVDRYNAKYILTKPFHHSQKHIETYEDGSMFFKLRVHHNFEIERLILGFGASIEVLKPRRLRQQIKRHLRNALSQYE